MGQLVLLQFFVSRPKKSKQLLPLRVVVHCSVHLQACNAVAPFKFKKLFGVHVSVRGAANLTCIVKVKVHGTGQQRQLVRGIFKVALQNASQPNRLVESSAKHAHCTTSVVRFHFGTSKRRGR